jgi:hypothetical protein
VLIVLAGLVAGACGAGGDADVSLQPTRVALERGIDGTCHALSDDGRHWSCGLRDSQHSTVVVKVDDRGAWRGEGTTAIQPAQTITIDGAVGTTGDFTGTVTRFGCCVPLP